MRLLLAVAVTTFGLAIAPTTGAVPGECPPFCDAIPDAAWIAPTSVPLYPVYRWPGLAALAVTASSPRFGFEAVCTSPPVAEDPRAYAVAARSVVLHEKGQWNLLVQVIHWRGDTATGGRTALSTLETARSQLRDCQSTADTASPSITTDDGTSVAAVISKAGIQVMHEYLLAHPGSSTVVELAMWSSLPAQVDWPAVADAQVLDAMAAALCRAYLGSCR
ncbi:ATPase [Mycobacterium sp. ACS1612]|uniref:ATPase n=1 Tax=Mycobacterium sp. ACS1612 TaxID=1834117 RepID=UPI0007FE6986|nr:ATPase [Mycobacterium sp. ACS1612]OBF40989.1 ATPase [Mycobacterium sp. ACS1612]